MMRNEAERLALVLPYLHVNPDPDQITPEGPYPCFISRIAITWGEYDYEMQQHDHAFIA